MKISSKTLRALNLPLSQDELDSIKEALYHRLSFTETVKPYTRSIEECWSENFTHKCTCPFHKEGRERTPSLFFSEKTKQFYCYGCSESGDIFNFLSVIKGRPWQFLVEDYLLNSDEEIDYSKDENRYSALNVTEFSNELNIFLAHTLRDLLRAHIGTEHYSKLQRWADSLFKRINERLVIKDLTIKELQQFKIQLTKEIYRKEQQYTQVKEDL